MSQFLTVPQARDAILAAGSGFFSVRFQPRGVPGTERRMLAKLGVRKWLKPAQLPPALDVRSQVAKAHEYLIVADMQKLAYRSIPLESVMEVKAKGLVTRPALKAGAPALRYKPEGIARPQRGL
jgi:hypothetical protein